MNVHRRLGSLQLLGWQSVAEYLRPIDRPNWPSLRGSPEPGFAKCGVSGRQKCAQAVGLLSARVVVNAGWRRHRYGVLTSTAQREAQMRYLQPADATARFGVLLGGEPVLIVYTK